MGLWEGLRPHQDFATEERDPLTADEQAKYIITTNMRSFPALSMPAPKAKRNDQKTGLISDYIDSKFCKLYSK